MEALERDVASPVASPRLISELVAALPSDTVAAPRNLSDSLHRKLSSIAEHNGGDIPLHGRMFAQWMHHAFPNECPYPHAAGALQAPLTHDEWTVRQNASSSAEPEVMKHFIDLENSTTDLAADDEFDEASMEWLEEEELLSEFDVDSPHFGGKLCSALRFLAMVGAVLATLAVAFDSFQKSASLLRPQGLKGAVCTGSLGAVKSYTV